MSYIKRAVRRCFSTRALTSQQNELKFVAEALESRVLLSVNPAYVGAFSATTKLVNGIPTFQSDAKVLFTSGGHGYVWRDGSKSWGIMRTYINGMMEDLGNQDQLQSYADYALRAGATFVSMRPIGHQTNEVIVDNAQTYTAANGGFDKSGTWSDVTTGTYWSENNGNDSVRYHYASTTTGAETSVARFTPKIPAAGSYPVYAWYVAGTNRADDTTFRINYNGGSQEVKVAQDKVGNGWVYLGTYYFGSGVNQASGSVQITNTSATTGKIVIADAIRFGNGMGDLTQSYTYPNGTGSAYVTKVYKNASNVVTASGQPRENEAALYWCYGMLGFKNPNTINDPFNVYGGNTSDDETKNFSACDHYAAYMNNAASGNTTDRVWISFHTNAGGGRGTKGLITGDATTNQTALATLAGNTVESEMIALNSEHEFDWANVSPTFTGGYSEIADTTLNGEMDATIIEVAFHDDPSDAALLKDPKVRTEVGRATYHTAIKYFDQFDSAFTNITYLPEPVRNLRVTTSPKNSTLTVLWSAPLSSSGTTGPYGNAATGYKIWTSTNGYGFDLAGTTTSTSFTLTGNLSDVTYVRVTSTNGGGESLPSIVAGAKPQLGRRAPILIVNNFDRLDRPGDQLESHYFGSPVSRVRPNYNNSFDYVVQAADAITAYNSSLGIEYCTDAAIAGGQIALANYAFVIWMSGEQSAGDGTFTAATQPLVSSYLNGGGKMFVSGSEIAWDLVARGNGSSFFANTLHATYAPDDPNVTPLTYDTADDAGVHATAAGINGTALAGVPALSFDNGTHGTYDVDYPDQLGAGSGATVAMNYSTGNGHGAVVQYASGNSKLVYMGFPFESIYTASQRNSLMSAVLNYFGANISLGAGAPDLVAGSDSGFSTTDNETNKNNSAGKTLQFTVGGTINGATINVYSDGTLIGTGTSTGGSITVTTNGATALLDGTHQITVRQVESGLSSSTDSSALSLKIDTVAPTLSNTSFAFDVPQQGLTFTFSEDVSSSIAAGDLVLHNNTTSIDLDPSNFSAAPSTNTALFNFPGYGNVLPNGNYTATIASANVADRAGNSPSSDAIANFYFQGADGDHNGTVAIQDFNILAINFGKPGQTFSQGNYDYSSDGIVNISDFNILAASFGKSVSTTAPAAPVSLQSTQSIGMAKQQPASAGSSDTASDDDLLSGVLL